MIRWSIWPLVRDDVALAAAFREAEEVRSASSDVRVWDLVGLDFVLEIGDVAGCGDHSVAFCGEGLDELVLKMVSLCFFLGLDLGVEDSDAFCLCTIDF